MNWKKSSKWGDQMRVWLYGRLSNDDDVKMNSLENQLEILREYAGKQGHQIIGESYDDNVSGMRFDRKGLNQMQQAVDAGVIDAVIIKDYCEIIGLNQKDLENQGILA